MGISDYQSSAWPDFIAHQLGPFGNLPVFLAIGNHELIPPMTRAEYLAQFADWLDTPVLREQRLKDDPADHKLKTYYHWIKGGVDFITLDNASPEQLDARAVALGSAADRPRREVGPDPDHRAWACMRLCRTA